MKKYRLPEGIGYPETLYPETANKGEILKKINEAGLTVTGECIGAERLYSDEEIESFRDEYTAIMEGELPEVKAAFEKTKFEAKKALDEAKDAVKACMTQVNDLIGVIRKGSVEEGFEAPNVVKIAVEGHDLYYAWIPENKCLTLVAVRDVPAGKDDELFDRRKENEEILKK